MNKPTLPPLTPIPDDIEDQIYELLHGPSVPELGDWLLELTKNAGHLSTGDEMRWRVLCLVWLAFEYSVDNAWPYLMWLNMNEATISTHLSEILIEAIDSFAAHVKIANWMATNEDDRLATFFKDFYAIPAQRKMKPLVSKLINRSTDPDVGVWLAHYCEGTAYTESSYLRRWRMLIAAWYAAGFNHSEGLSYLKALTNDAEKLPTADNQLLMEAAGESGATTPLIQLIADCPDPTINRMLNDFGHPDLSVVANTILQSKPDNTHQADSSEQARLDADLFKCNLACLQESGILPKSATLLDLACGPLAPQTLLFNSVGYKIVGVDLHIPPQYLPLNRARQWFKRRQHANTWKSATEAYYQTLSQAADVKLKWNKAKINLADITRLDQADSTFDAAICSDYLHYAPDVKGLMAEVARVLKSGGLFVANIQPYAGLNGAFQADSNSPWGHLREEQESSVLLNKWRESQFKETFDRYFSVEQWQPEEDPQAKALLTTALRAKLASYSEAELTRKQIMIVARKK